MKIYRPYAEVLDFAHGERGKTYYGYYHNEEKAKEKVKELKKQFENRPEVLNVDYMIEETVD